jgi:predicted aspartyl protease
MNVIGSFNKAGSPTIEIGVHGPFTQPTIFTAIVDTGFSGFLLLPLLEAFPIGLILRGTTTINLADGTNQTKLACLGSVNFDGQDKVGVVIIEWLNTDILVGMDFLRKFNKQLLVDPVIGRVELQDTIPPSLPVLPTAPIPPTVP